LLKLALALKKLIASRKSPQNASKINKMAEAREGHPMGELKNIL
jgi:hypothetical protein